MRDSRVDGRAMLSCLTFFACAAFSACGGGGGDSSTAAVSAASAPTTSSQSAAAIAATAAAAAASGQSAVTAGLAGKLIVGYQGWFGCPGDFEDNTAWQHWFASTPSTQSLTVDALPSVQGLAATDLCDTGLPTMSGGTMQLFSSQQPDVVMTHFLWMKQHGIDGAAVQRFVSDLSVGATQRRTDNVLANARAAAEANGRVFYLTYDVSGADPASVVATIRSDWLRVVSELNVTQSTAYLQDNGKPVLQLWGFGFTDRPGQPAEVASLIADLQSGSAGLPAATVIGGVPTDWRTLTGDSNTDPAWAAVYRAYDVISPWTVGRFSDQASTDAFVQSVVVPDMAEAQRVGVRYLPVIFPGFSWHNLMVNRGEPANGLLNAIPRMCGNFMWRQVYDLLNAHSTMMYAAMFDEVDEGTALFPVEPLAGNLPVGAQMIYLDEDGCALPSDWYLSVTGQAAQYVRSATVPPQLLQQVIQP